MEICETYRRWKPGPRHKFKGELCNGTCHILHKSAVSFSLRTASDFKPSRCLYPMPVLPKSQRSRGFRPCAPGKEDEKRGKKKGRKEEKKEEKEGKKIIRKGRKKKWERKSFCLLDFEVAVKERGFQGTCDCLG